MRERSPARASSGVSLWNSTRSTASITGPRVNVSSSGFGSRRRRAGHRPGRALAAACEGQVCSSLPPVPGPTRTRPSSPVSQCGLCHAVVSSLIASPLCRNRRHPSDRPGAPPHSTVAGILEFIGSSWHRLAPALSCPACRHHWRSSSSACPTCAPRCAALCVHGTRAKPRASGARCARPRPPGRTPSRPRRDRKARRS